MTASKKTDEESFDGTVLADDDLLHLHKCGFEERRIGRRGSGCFGGCRAWGGGERRIGHQGLLEGMWGGWEVMGRGHGAKETTSDRRPP
jgi:hypothetical protein